MPHWSDAVDPEQRRRRAARRKLKPNRSPNQPRVGSESLRAKCPHKPCQRKCEFKVSCASAMEFRAYQLSFAGGQITPKRVDATGQDPLAGFFWRVQQLEPDEVFAQSHDIHVSIPELPQLPFCQCLCRCVRFHTIVFDPQNSPLFIPEKLRSGDRRARRLLVRAQNRNQVAKTT